MKKYLFIILLIILDFVTKRIVFNYLNLNSFVTITSILDLRHIHNYGILFGFFSGIIPPWLIVIIGSIVTANICIRNGVEMIRVHNVKETKQMISIWSELE